MPVRCISLVCAKLHTPSGVSIETTKRIIIDRPSNKNVVTYKRNRFMANPPMETNFITSIKSQINGTRNANIYIDMSNDEMCLPMGDTQIDACATKSLATTRTTKNKQTEDEIQQQ